MPRAEMTAISILIPTRERFDLLEACLASLMEARRECAEVSELIVVNDGNPDSPRRIVASHDPQARVIDLSQNVGFSGAVNEGLAGANGDWILVLNDDTTLERASIKELLRVARAHSRVGSVTPQLRFARDPDTINSAGLIIDDLGVTQ